MPAINLVFYEGWLLRVLQLIDGNYQLIVAGDRLDTSTLQRADAGYTKRVKVAETQEVESCINRWQDR